MVLLFKNFCFFLLLVLSLKHVCEVSHSLKALFDIDYITYFCPINIFATNLFYIGCWSINFLETLQENLSLHFTFKSSDWNPYTSRTALCATKLHVLHITASPYIWRHGCFSFLLDFELKIIFFRRLILYRCCIRNLSIDIKTLTQFIYTTRKTFGLARSISKCTASFLSTHIK